ncbi:MAG: hypothetical protein HDQ98_11725 [Lachnospiraceae bacterium]|nr:hypothetical protein [Lachnospiraceae bacterium]
MDLILVSLFASLQGGDKPLKEKLGIASVAPFAGTRKKDTITCGYVQTCAVYVRITPHANGACVRIVASD